MNELDILEQQADVLLRHVEINTKKLRQQKLKLGTWDLRRLEATLRIINELNDLAAMINELLEHSDREQIVKG